MDFPWYYKKKDDEPLTQGDIILQLYVPDVQPSSEFPYFESISYPEDVIILTQACDLENKKVEMVTLGRVVLLREVVENHFQKQCEMNGKEYIFEKINPSKIENYVNKIRSGSFLDLYLLNKYSDDEIDFPYRVVYLKETFKMPLSSLELAVKNSEAPILRLLPPYREHLAHNFSFNYSRIGLPVDVKFKSEYL
ncbi:hypothetical protein [Bacillus altitudinis]|uniref:hypothetical protein n=1 Tax=Bacillus altitudinis TaxID=293387 RepID=UPI003F7C7389